MKSQVIPEILKNVFTELTKNIDQQSFLIGMVSKPQQLNFLV